MLGLCKEGRLRVQRKMQMDCQQWNLGCWRACGELSEVRSPKGKRRDAGELSKGMTARRLPFNLWGTDWGGLQLAAWLERKTEGSLSMVWRSDWLCTIVHGSSDNLALEGYAQWECALEFRHASVLLDTFLYEDLCVSLKVGKVRPPWNQVLGQSGETFTVVVTVLRGLHSTPWYIWISFNIQNGICINKYIP